MILLKESSPFITKAESVEVVSPSFSPFQVPDLMVPGGICS